MAETLTLAPASHGQPSRKGKKAWRKNVDLTELHSGLETVREEIVKTGGVIAEKSAQQLFSLDTTGDLDVEKSLANKKRLRADEIIAQRSAVPGLDGRKRKPDEAATAPTASKRYKSGDYVSHKELQRLKSIREGALAFIPTQNTTAAHDPWAVVPSTRDPRLTYLDEAKPIREPDTVKHIPVSLAASNKPLPAVRVPGGGKSYNPLVDDWSALLAREGAAAVTAEKARLIAEAEAEAEEERVQAEIAKVEKAEKDAFGTDVESAWESEWDGIASGVEEEIFAMKQRERKTPAERKKVVARKEREAREKWERKQKVRDAEEKRIGAIAAESRARHRAAVRAAAEVDSEASMSGDDEAPLHKRRFGKIAIPDAPLEVVLPEDLQDSLRRLKPEGNLTMERYRGLLVSGKVEMRKKVWQPKQRKTERTEKWSYKDWKLR